MYERYKKNVFRNIMPLNNTTIVNLNYFQQRALTQKDSPINVLRVNNNPNLFKILNNFSILSTYESKLYLLDVLLLKISSRNSNSLLLIFIAFVGNKMKDLLVIPLLIALITLPQINSIKKCPIECSCDLDVSGRYSAVCERGEALEENSLENSLLIFA